MKYILLLFPLFLVSCWTQRDDIHSTSNTSYQKKEVILALWDSLTAWYGLQESESYPSQLQKELSDEGYNYDVINAWVSWDTSANLLSRASLYIEKNPSIILLVIGWNDGLRGLSTWELKQNILSIIDIFPEAKIVLGGMDIPENLWISYRNDFKKVYSEIASERKEIYFLEYFLEWVWGDPQYNITDMIHPNREWYEIIVENLMNFLEKNKILTQ